jgi:transposase
MLVLCILFSMCLFLLRLFADAGYQGPKFQRVVAEIIPQLSIEIVIPSDQARGFEVLPKRWVAERKQASVGRRRLAKDFDNPTRKAAVLIRLASIGFMRRRLWSPS